MQSLAHSETLYELNKTAVLLLFSLQDVANIVDNRDIILLLLCPRAYVLQICPSPHLLLANIQGNTDTALTPKELLLQKTSRTPKGICYRQPNSSTTSNKTFGGNNHLKNAEEEEEEEEEEKKKKKKKKKEKKKKTFCYQHR